MTRFFASPQDVSLKSIMLETRDSEHIRALRLRPDELFIVCDGSGTDYICRLGQREDGTIAEIINKHPSSGEPSIKCTVFIAYAKGERLEYAVQKSVELGAHEIVLFESERCIAIPRDLPKKIARLQRIALEAAKQSGRGVIPSVTVSQRFESMINEAVKRSDLTFLCYEDENKLHIKNLLDNYFPPLREQEEYEIKSVSIITGPEGGFAPHEIELAQTNDIPIVSLGPRILRSETAPAVALTAVMYQTGNL